MNNWKIFIGMNSIYVLLCFLLPRFNETLSKNDGGNGSMTQKRKVPLTKHLTAHSFHSRAFPELY